MARTRMAMGPIAAGYPYNSNIEFFGAGFDGNAFMRLFDPTGFSASGQGMLSTWINPQAVDGVQRYLFYYNEAGAAADIGLDIQGDGKLNLRINRTASGIAIMRSSSALTVGQWHHVLASWDVNQVPASRRLQLYINDVDATVISSNTGAAFTLGSSFDSLGVSCDNSGTQRFNGYRGRDYFAMGQSLDLSVEANRRKFIDASGNPVNLGADGSLPTGTAPQVYLGNTYTQYQINEGAGGDFVLSGSLTNSPSSP